MARLKPCPFKTEFMQPVLESYRRLLRRKHLDRHQIPHPARGVFFACGNQAARQAAKESFLSWRMMERQFWQDFIGKPARNVLGDFGVGLIPILRLCFDCESDRIFLRESGLLQAANVDLSYQFQPTLRRLLKILPEQIPMVGQWCDGETAYGSILTDKKAW